MLRVGLTGELGSGKSTVARMLSERGALVLSSDEMGRALMQPGQQVFAKIVAAFGRQVLSADGTLDRKRLAVLAFDAQRPRVEELNAIIHPAVIEEQAIQMAELARAKPHAIVVVESALIFSTQHGARGGWRSRFDKVLIVTAPDEVKMERFIARIAAERTLSAEERAALSADAWRRLRIQHQTPCPSDGILLRNDGDVDALERQVDVVWEQLLEMERQSEESQA
ncbi:MAG: dephospho-CoA kinase [Acidobacteriota bacterium]